MRAEAFQHVATLNFIAPDVTLVHAIDQFHVIKVASFMGH